jgi:hypothetical protein
MFGKVKKYEIESWITFWQSTLRVHFQKAYLATKKKKKKKNHDLVPNYQTHPLT